MRAQLLAALTLVACGDAATSGFSTGPGITTATTSTGTGSTGSTTGDASTTSSTSDSVGGSGSGSTGTIRDVGAEVDFGTGQPPGCKGKVDVLFLISSFGTMAVEQKQLLASFPGFIDTIEDKLEGFDVHIMAANTTGKWSGWTCEQSYEGCVTNYPECDPVDAVGYECVTFPEMLTLCDAELGAGLLFNAGYFAANKICALHGGNRYIVADEPDLDSAFECIAKVGAGGGDPAMGDALIAALSPKLNGEGGCNEGFLREDALLFVVLINDTEDYESKSWPYQQYDAIIKAKKDPNAVVMLGVIGQVHKEGEPKIPGCTYDGTGKQKVRDLLNMFPNKIEGDTCAKDYAPYFAEATSRLAEACGSFIPQ